ncbi:MAG TPA: WbqC family protein, partial [Thermoanaerobaculia bacterium]|nr:WbqC family protein [Thermoanaerobaculia bacterium]
KGEDRVLEILEHAKGDVYVSGPAAKQYIHPERFEERGIVLIWKDYDGYPEYPQFHPPFVHKVTILDLLFHTGGKASQYIWGWRADP